MSRITMESTLAGAWYSADPDRLRKELELFLHHAGVQADPALCAVVMPHAGYAYSGPCAAFGARALALRGGLRRVVVLGFSHRVRMPNAVSVPSRETDCRTPLGDIPLDTDALAALRDHPLFADVPETRRSENSVEMQIPLLQAALEGIEWSLVPVTLGQLDPDARSEAARALSSLMDDDTVWVVSSDFTHYGPDFGYVPFTDSIEENLRRLDGGAIDRILAGDAGGFEAYCRETGATICGRDSIGVFLNLLPRPFTARELAYDTSGRITGDYRNSVSYASLAFYHKESP
ncbi:MAG: AmmeMemoRadiSam system protein B [Lentisphaerae bacterium]|nr:AmmeMemoRadiSam system protein B [Lentisphaerota bacterium]